MSLRVETYARLIRDVLDSLARTGFERLLIVNGHGGNQPAQAVAIEWMAEHPEVRVKFHNWWNAPRTLAKVRRSIRSPRTRPGWRIFRGRAFPAPSRRSSRSR